MNLVSPNGVSSVDWARESLAAQNQQQLKWHKVSTILELQQKHHQ